jgi:hypothetical protein
VLAEVVFRSGLKPIHALAEIDLVGVQGEYLLLGKCPLDLNGEKNFLQLAAEGLLAGQKKITRQLHGQGGSALSAAIRGQIVIGSAQHTKDVDPPMALEVLILNGDHRLAQDGRNGLIGNHDAALQGKGAEDAPMHVEQIGRGDGPVAFQVINLRQVDRVDQHEAGQGPGDDGENQQGEKGNAAR